MWLYATDFQFVSGDIFFTSTKTLLISIMVNNESDEGYNTEMQPKHGARKELGHSIAMGQNSNELPIIENEDDEIQFGEQYDGIVNVSKLEDVCSTEGCPMLKKLKYEYSLLSSSVVPHWRNSYKGLKQNIAMESTNGSPAVVELPCTPEFLPFWDDEHFCRKLNKYEIFSNLDKDEKMILKFCIEKLATDFLRQVIAHGGLKGDEWISFMKKLQWKLPKSLKRS
ncbi:4-beta-mannosidase,Mannan endo-1 [Trichinella pseudospiralis]